MDPRANWLLLANAALGNFLAGTASRVRWLASHLIVAVAGVVGLLTLVGLGLALVASFAITGLASGFAVTLLRLVGLADEGWAPVMFTVIGIVLGLLANWFIFLWVIARLPRERGLMRQEIERLALYLGPGSGASAAPADLEPFLGVEPEASLFDAASDAFGGRIGEAMPMIGSLR